MTLLAGFTLGQVLTPSEWAKSEILHEKCPKCAVYPMATVANLVAFGPKLTAKKNTKLAALR